MTEAHAAACRKAGLSVAVVAVSWDRFEPRAGEFDAKYADEKAAEMKKLREAGFRLQLDFGMQYAPGWAQELKGGRYRNQYGEDFCGSAPGEVVANGVFSREVREALAGYMAEVFRRLGTNWDFVWLGGGKFGETNFPSARYRGQENCYWGFDELAQGKAVGRAEGIPACPAAGWKPGGASEKHEAARKFAEWYLDALKNFQDWQIATVRRDYAGRICLLYGSWGLRPGWLEGAIEGDLSGATSAERNGEVQQGYDWARMIAAVRDPKAIVYCTWLDGTIENRDIADDESKDAARWSPAHWQASLARANPLDLPVWGENTGHNNREAMRITFDRIRQDRLMGVMWAFDGELFAEPATGKFATLEDFGGMIGGAR